MRTEPKSGDDLLWQAFIDGSMEAYARIYELHAKSMYNYGLHFCQDEGRVEDAIHDVFIKLYANRGRLSVPANIKLYLLISLKNTLFNLNNKKDLKFSIDISSRQLTDNHNIETLIIENEESEHERLFTKRVEETLSNRQKQAVYYRFVGRLNYKEIGAIMEINAQSAKNLVHSSIKKLRKLYPRIPEILLLAFLLSL